MKTRHLGQGFEVGAFGFGCMGLTGVYGDQEAEASVATCGARWRSASRCSTRRRSTAPTRTRSWWDAR